VRPERTPKEDLFETKRRPNATSSVGRPQIISLLVEKLEWPQHYYLASINYKLLGYMRYDTSFRVLKRLVIP
jgi:hypothetical protein